MMNDNNHVHLLSCEDVDDILEQRAEGVPLDPEVQRSLDHHLETCAECRDLSKALGGLSAFATLPADDTIASLLGGADVYFKERKRKNIATVIAAAGSVAAAVIFVLVYVLGSPAVVPPRAPNCTPESPFAAAEGVRISRCVGTTAKIDTKEDGTVWVTLQQGGVGLSIDPDRPHKRPVVVDTPFGEARVKGTVLSVHLSENDARVEVFRGVVEIRPKGDSSVPMEVSAGRAAYLSESSSFDLAEKPWGEQLRLALEQTADLPEAADEDTSDNSVQSDTEAAPLSVDTDEDSDTNETQRPRHKAAPLGTLLEEAQSYLIAKDWKNAAQRYREIQRSYPQSQEASHSLISLARIELRHLGHPEKALRYFNRYRTQVPKGPLAQEAILGAAECNRRLGRSKQEAAALREFLSRYPSSPSAEKAKARLKEL